MDLLKYLDARLGEASTWAVLAGLLASAHANVDPGLWSQITLWGTAAAGAAGVLLKERGTVSASKLASDSLAALAAGARSGPVAALLGFFLVASVAGCGSPPATTVVAAESGLAVSGHAALVYLGLPVCTGANGPVCSTPAAKAKVKAAFDQAYDAVTAAQAVADAGGSPDLAAATAALAALQGVMAGLPGAGA
jgi:hypothetical protein